MVNSQAPSTTSFDSLSAASSGTSTSSHGALHKDRWHQMLPPAASNSNNGQSAQTRSVATLVLAIAIPVTALLLTLLGLTLCWRRRQAQRALQERAWQYKPTAFMPSVSAASHLSAESMESLRISIAPPGPAPPFAVPHVTHDKEYSVASRPQEEAVSSGQEQNHRPVRQEHGGDSVPVDGLRYSSEHSEDELPPYDQAC